MSDDDERDLFKGLRDEIGEHAKPEYLKLKDGECIVVTVVVDRKNEDPAKRTPREELVLNFDKTDKIWKLRLDLLVGNSKKVFYVGQRDKAEVLALLERGVRKISICRYGSTAQTTKYTFTEVKE